MGLGASRGFAAAGGAVPEGWKRSDTPFRTIPTTDRITVIVSTAITASRSQRMDYFFLVFFPLLSKLVWIDSPIEASIALAVSALGPLGWSARYF
jgi:hypothetical protein